MSARKKAFTLIELLVVIAIVGLLMAVLLPALNKAKYQAMLAICKTRQKSVLTGLHLYMNEWDNKMMPTIQGRITNPRTLNIGWTIPVRMKYHYRMAGALNGGSVPALFGSYLEDPAVFNCPVTRQSVEWQRNYINGINDEAVTMLNGSFMLLWNYQRFKEDYGIEFVPGKDNLMIMDILIHGEQLNAQAHHNGRSPWISSHRMRGSSLLDFVDTVNLPHLLKLYQVAQDRSDVPDIPINCGFIDGHVDSMSAARDFENRMPEGYFFPRNRK